MKTIYLSVILSLISLFVHSQNLIFEGFQSSQTFDVQKKIPWQRFGSGTDLNLRTGNCSDTLFYPLSKASQFTLLNFVNTKSYGAAQYFDTPQQITVYGFDFFGKVNDNSSSTVEIECAIYNAGPDSLPKGTALATKKITIDSSSGNGSLQALLKTITFNSPVTINGPYVLTVTNNTAVPVGLAGNSYVNGDGNNEWLSAILFNGNWINSREIVLGNGVLLNNDFALIPHVSYSFDSDFMIPSAACPNIKVSLENNSSEIVTSRFFNQAVFNNQSKDVYNWDYGDGSAIDKRVNGSHTYLDTGLFAITLTDSIIGWTGVCTDSKTQNITIQPDTVNPKMEYQISGMQVAFADSTEGVVTSWSWDFGDGNSSTEQHPSHTYSNNGNHIVCMTITTSCGDITDCHMVTIGSAVTSCDSLENMTDQASLVGISPDGSSPGGFTGGTNYLGDLAKAEFFSNSGEFTVNAASFWIAKKAGNNFIEAVVWDDDGTNGNPGTILAKELISLNDVVAQFKYGTTVAFSNPPTITGNFYVGLTISQVPGDTIVLAVANPSTSVNTAWSKRSSGKWEPYDVQFPWGQKEAFGVRVFEYVKAGFSLQTTGNKIAFTDTSKGVKQWFWDFGDGNTSTERNPNHTYLSSGIYNVCLTVSNGTSCDEILCREVSTEGCVKPTADFGFTLEADTLVSFYDSSSSATEWTWHFGDSAMSTEQNPVHAFDSTAIYKVCLYIKDSCFTDTVCKNISIIKCIKPKAEFTYNNELDLVTFNDSSSGTKLSYSWEFGDGDTSDVPNPSKMYGDSGTYNVCLVVENSCGSDTSCMDVKVAGCPEVVGGFKFNDNNGTVSFTDTSSGNPNKWFWGLGGGATTKDQNPVHTYSKTGVYNVCLFVNSECDGDTVCELIKVTVVGIDDYSSGEKVIISSNEITKLITFTIEDHNSSSYTLQLLDITGREVMQTNPFIQQVSFDTGSLIPGTYIYRIRDRSEDKLLWGKVMIY